MNRVNENTASALEGAEPRCSQRGVLSTFFLQALIPLAICYLHWQNMIDPGCLSSAEEAKLLQRTGNHQCCPELDRHPTQTISSQPLAGAPGPRVFKDDDDAVSSMSSTTTKVRDQNMTPLDPCSLSESPVQNHFLRKESSPPAHPSASSTTAEVISQSLSSSLLWTAASTPAELKSSSTTAHAVKDSTAHAVKDFTSISQTLCPSLLWTAESTPAEFSLHRPRRTRLRPLLLKCYLTSLLRPPANG